ncbi:MAG: hypothetical protein ACR2RE_13600 [Geminicoccaceae bacterium]
MSLEHLRSMVARQKEIKIGGEPYIVKSVPISSLRDAGQNGDDDDLLHMVNLWCYGLHDANGNRLFDPASEASRAECHKLLEEVGYGVANEVAEAVSEVSGSDVDAAKN